MADVSITPALVVPDSGANIIQGTAGETITAGMTVYLKSDSKWWKAQCDGTAAEAGATNVGLAMTGSSAGQSINVMLSGTVTIGGTVVATTQYIVSATAGGLCPIADIASTNYLTLIAYGISTTKVTMNKNATGIAKA